LMLDFSGQLHGQYSTSLGAASLARISHTIEAHRGAESAKVFV